MKNILFSICLLITFTTVSNAQIFKKSSKKTTTSKPTLNSTDISGALKEALNIGAEKSVQKLSLENGFFENNAIKVLMPPEAQSLEKTLRSIGLGRAVDDVILSMNRASEDAVKSATSIFVNAIKNMNIQDASRILKGNENAATLYLKGKTNDALISAFTPIVEKSMNKVGVAKYWSTVSTAYNAFPLTTKVQPNLTAYITEKALDGIFYQIGEEEKNIRKDPLGQTSNLIQNVFSNL